MGDYLPKFKPGESFTRTTSAAVTGGQIITATGAVAGADAINWIGVAGHDAASGMPVTVFSGGVQRLTSSAAITAGALVKCAANGRVAPFVSGTDAPERLVGVALEAAGAAAVVIAVKIR